jgi:hypothetical protein
MFVLVLRQYCFPACGKFPEHDLPTFFPDKCRHCHARLRQTCSCGSMPDISFKADGFAAA